MKPGTRERLKEEILYVIKTRRMYKDNDYTVKRLAEELNTNVRYVSLVLGECYGMNYKTFVNKLRIEDAMTMLRSEEYDDVSVEDIGTAVGFLNRQSFFTYFTKIAGTTPRRYRSGIREAREKERVSSGEVRKK